MSSSTSLDSPGPSMDQDMAFRQKPRILLSLCNRSILSRCMDKAAKSISPCRNSERSHC